MLNPLKLQICNTICNKYAKFKQFTFYFISLSFFLFPLQTYLLYTWKQKLIYNFFQWLRTSCKFCYLQYLAPLSNYTEKYMHTCTIFMYYTYINMNKYIYTYVFLLEHFSEDIYFDLYQSKYSNESREF